MAVLGRLLVASGERLDLADILSIDSYTAGDFKYLLQGLIGGTTPLILKGFEVLSPGSAIGTQNIAIGIANAVVLYPSSLAGPFYVGLPEGNLNAQPLVPELVQNATNFVYLTFTTFDTSQDSRAFWDPDLNGGAGGEFTQDINTESVLSVQVGVSTSAFPDNTVPVCKVVMGPTVISSIEDCREMMFRLGSGGTNPDPNNNFNWPSVPNSTYRRTEPPTVINTGGGANPFEGADKNITNLKMWMDAVMTKLKELGGTAFWYDDVSTFNVVNSFFDAFGTVLQGKGLWQHSSTVAGQITWTEDINIRILPDPRTYILRGPGTIQLANDEVAYLDLARNAQINGTDLPVAFTNGAMYVNTIGNAVGLFADLAIGDYIKSITDPTQNFVRIEQFYDSVNATGSITTAALAKSVLLAAPYLGATTNNKARYDQGVYTSSDVIISNRFAAPITSAGGNFFWLAYRSDTIVNTSQLVPTNLSIIVDSNDGSKAHVTSSVPHGLSDNQRVIITGTTNYNGTFQVEVESSTTFFITVAAVFSVPQAGSAHYATVTTAARTSPNGFPLESANNGFPTDSTVIISNTVNYNGSYQIAVIDPTHFNIPFVGGSAPPPGSPNLATAATYGILGASTVTNTGFTVVTGDLGLYPGTSVTGFPPGTVSGVQNIANAAANQAQLDALAAYTDLTTRPFTTIPAVLDGQTLTAGVYHTGAASLAASGPGTLTLNGSATDIFVIVTASTLTTGAGGMPTIALTGGAVASNVYWCVGSSATINSGTAGVFNGTIIAQASVTDTMGGTVNGRLIALTAAVTLSAAANITVPAGGSTPPETAGLATLAAVIVRTQTGPFTLFMGQSVPVNGTFFNTGVGGSSFVGGAPDYALPPGYNTLSGTQNFNSLPTDSIVTRVSQLTGMMADKAQDKTIKYLPFNLTTITNTTSGANQVITYQGPGATLTLLQPGSPGNAVITLPSAGGISLPANSSAYVIINRNAASTPSIIVAPNASIPVNENLFVIAERLSGSTVYSWDGYTIPAGAAVPVPGYGVVIEEQDRNLKLVRGGDWAWGSGGSSPANLALNGAQPSSIHLAGSTTTWWGQSFTSIVTGNITTAALYIARSGAMTGTFVYKIYSDSAGLPSTLLGTSAPMNFSTIYNGSIPNPPQTGTFGTAIPVVSGTKYHLILDATGYGSGIYTFGGSSSGSPYAGGNIVNTTNSGGSWNTFAAEDFAFTVDGNAPSPSVLSWSANANFQIPGLADSVNVLIAGNVTLPTDGNVAYVEVNRTGPGGSLTPIVADIAAVPLDANTVIFARKVGANVVVGNNSMLLIPGESKPLYAGVSDQNLALIGSSVTEATSNPGYAARGSVNRIELDTEGALDAIARHDAEFDKYFGMFRMIAKPTSTRVRITGSDRVVFTGETLTQAMSSLRVSFTGAEIDFATGSIFGGDATLPLTTNFSTPLGINFTPATIAANQFLWYSVAALPSGTNPDNTINVQFNVIAGTSSGATLLLANKPPLAGPTPLGYVGVQENGGGSAINNVVQANIAQLGVGAGSGNGTGLLKVRLNDPIDTVLPTGAVTIDGQTVNDGDLVLFSNLTTTSTVWSQTVQTSTVQAASFNGITDLGGQFTPTGSGGVSTATFALQNTGAATGSLVCNLYTAVGQVLIGTSNAVNIASIPTVHAPVAFTFSTPVAVTSGTAYLAIVHVVSITNPTALSEWGVNPAPADSAYFSTTGGPPFGNNPTVAPYLVISATSSTGNNEIYKAVATPITPVTFVNHTGVTNSLAHTLGDNSTGIIEGPYFTAAQTGKITSGQISVTFVSGTGNIVADLYHLVPDNTGSPNQPTMTLLETSSPINITTLPSTLLNPALTTFTFAGTTTLTSGLVYAMVVRVSNPAGSDVRHNSRNSGTSGGAGTGLVAKNAAFFPIGFFQSTSSDNPLVYQGDVNVVATGNSLGGVSSWQPQFVFNGSVTPLSGDMVVITAGTAFADTIGIFDGTTWNFNKKVRYFNGADYWEISSLNSVVLADNQAAPADVFSIAFTGSQNLMVDYSINRGTTKETGTVTMTTDGTTVGIATVNVDLGVTAGITFTGDISGSNIRLRYTSTSTGSAGTMKFVLRRWSDAAGGPGGIPSYSGAAPSGVTSITAGTGLSGGTITGVGTIALANTAVTPGSYTNTNLTVDAQGRITAASNGFKAFDIVVGNAGDVTAGIAQFSTIATAIAAATTGQRIFLLERTWVENVSVNKQLDIIGSGYASYINGTFTYTSAADHSRINGARISGAIDFNAGTIGCIISDCWQPTASTLVDSGSGNYYVIAED